MSDSPIDLPALTSRHSTEYFFRGGDSVILPAGISHTQRLDLLMDVMIRLRSSMQSTSSWTAPTQVSPRVTLPVQTPNSPIRLTSAHCLQTCLTKNAPPLPRPPTGYEERLVKG